MGGRYGAASFVQILAPELNDRMLADFLDMDSSLIVTLHMKIKVQRANCSIANSNMQPIQKSSGSKNCSGSKPV